ncbi:MAG TPA: HEAT repeat domain-containing protein, partial [Kofleriaceae bacterium]
VFRAELRDARPTVRRDGAQTTMPAAAFSFPFYFTTSEQGQLVALHFPKATDDAARGALTTLASIAQLSLAPGASWQAIESDTLGDYDVHYVESARGVHRTREQYRRAAGADVIDVSILSTGTDLELRADGWPAEIAGSESTRLGTQELGVVADAKFTLRHIAVAAVDAGWPEGLEVVAVDAVAANERASEVDDRELAGGATFADLLVELSQITDDHTRGYQFLRMAALFRLDPSSVALAAAAVANHDPNASLIVGALGEAGTPVAQRALADMLASQTPGDETAVHAAVSLGLTQSPTRATFDALAAATRRNDDVGNTALLAFGNAASRIADEDPAEAARRVDELLARLARSQDDDERLLLLRALGNTGDARILPALAQALASSNVAVRTAATEALRLVPGIDSLLAMRFADPAPLVREAAVFAASQRELTPLLAVLASSARDDRDVSVRRAIVELAGARQNEHVELRAIVSHAAQHDPDSELRETAQRLLANA